MFSFFFPVQPLLTLCNVPSISGTRVLSRQTDTSFPFLFFCSLLTQTCAGSDGCKFAISPALYQPATVTTGGTTTAGKFSTPLPPDEPQRHHQCALALQPGGGCHTPVRRRVVMTRAGDDVGRWWWGAVAMWGGGDVGQWWRWWWRQWLVIACIKN